MIIKILAFVVAPLYGLAWVAGRLSKVIRGRWEDGRN